MPSPPSKSGPALRFQDRRSCRLLLFWRPLLLWTMLLNLCLLVRPRLRNRQVHVADDHLSCKWLWQQRWVIDFLFSFFYFPRCSYLRELPRRLPEQRRKDPHCSSGARLLSVTGVHCIWHWARWHLLRRHNDHHRWKRDDLDGRDLRRLLLRKHHCRRSEWELHSSSHCREHQQCGQPHICFKWWLHFNWLEPNMVCSFISERLNTLIWMVRCIYDKPSLQHKFW